MSKSDAFEADLLKLIFNATPIANLADNASVAPLTNIAVAGHTADPGETGNMTTNETAYTGYARASVPCTAGGWTISGSAPTVASPVAPIAWPPCTGGAGTITHASCGPTGGGATEIYYSGPVTPNISVSNGVTPQLTTASTISED
jgi:hypothetical protein